MNSPVTSSDDTTRDYDLLQKGIIFFKDEKPDLALKTFNLIHDVDDPTVWFWKGVVNENIDHNESRSTTLPVSFHFRELLTDP